MKLTKEARETLDALGVIPRLDNLKAICADAARRAGMDDQLAPIWAEKLRYTYTKIFEVKYPEYAAANGDVLPIDTSVDPASLEWEYFTIDHAGYADWIDDDGHVAPSSALKASRKVGRMGELGHRWDVTVFDLERASKANVPIASMKQKNAKKYHDARTNWVWMFGDSSRELPGLANHPNIQISVAPTKATGSLRVWDANATNDEIATDVATAINAVAETTLEAYHCVKLFMPPSYFRLLRDRRLGAGDGFASLLDLLKNRYSGDESGQGKVEFRILNECESTRRVNPVTGTDTSGITGNFLLAIPNADKDELAFIRARPFTQRPPQERDLVMHHMTHSKIGGCKCQVPTAVHRFDFAVGT